MAIISFKQFLSEIFDGSNIAKWTVINQVDPLLVSFKVKDNDYMAAINRSAYWDHNVYNITFGRDKVAAGETMRLISQYQISDALKVYNTIINVMRIKVSPYLKERDEITFESYDPRTIPLYTKFAKMIAKEFNGKYTRNGSSFRVTI